MERENRQRVSGRRKIREPGRRTAHGTV